MTDPKFTPGPWRLGNPRTNSIVCDTPIPEWNTDKTVDHYGGHLVAESLTDGNARLIAAAPDLYEALKRIVESVSQGTSGECCQASDFDDARAALRKVRGEP